jgi:hypothetical protein
MFKVIKLRVAKRESDTFMAFDKKVFRFLLILKALSLKGKLFLLALF